MSDVAAQAGNALGAAVTSGIKQAETAIGSVIGRIVTGAEKEWKVIQADIEGQVAAVQKALPASATAGLPQLETDVKQGASDALSAAANGIVVLEPAAVAAIENVLDAALAQATGGAAIPLVPLLNNGINTLGSYSMSVVQAWMLKRQAAAASAYSAS